MSADKARAALIAELAQQGPWRVSDFMRFCLADPRYGYYRHRDPLGREGDFITAPEISQIFGELIGLWCLATWREGGAQTPIHLIELGPGRGTLMADLLRAARLDPRYLEALTLHLVEISPLLRDAQRRRLAEAGPTVHWHDTPGQALAAAPVGALFVIANEFFDALPVDQYVRESDGWHERHVALSPEGAPGFVSGPAVAVPPGLPPHLLDAPAGAIHEHGAAGAALAAAIGSTLCGRPGAALIIDYGYDGPGLGDTLQAVRAHSPIHVFAAPGLSDLTAHVDFPAIARAAEGAGARVSGPLSQGAFLMTLGLKERAEALAARVPKKAEAILSAAERLADPAQMGDLFKVLCLSAPAAPVPTGFAISPRQGGESAT